jgi:hypothetical protein
MDNGLAGLSALSTFRSWWYVLVRDFTCVLTND